MSAVAIEVHNLSVKYPSHTEQTLKNVSFSIPEGKVTIFIGPNGSGKSTCIRALLDMIPYEGKVTFWGEKREKKDSTLGYLPQRFVFEKSMPLTVFEFLELALTLCHHSVAEKTKLIDRALQAVALDGKKYHLLRDLSGGELQRILLARALVHNPRLVVLDEPEAGIDLHSEGNLYHLLQKLVQEQGVTVVMASHEIHLVPKFAHHVICFHEGKIEEGSPETVMNSEFFASTYGESFHFYNHPHDLDSSSVPSSKQRKSSHQSHTSMKEGV